MHCRHGSSSLINMNLQDVCDYSNGPALRKKTRNKNWSYVHQPTLSSYRAGHQPPNVPHEFYKHYPLETPHDRHYGALDIGFQGDPDYSYKICNQRLSTNPYTLSLDMYIYIHVSTDIQSSCNTHALSSSICMISIEYIYQPVLTYTRLWE